MLRLINCRHATLLIEQRQDPAAPRTERASLWLHLRLCRYCKRYSRQSIQIAEWARASAVARAQAGPALSATAKERMRERLVAAAG